MFDMEPASADTTNLTIQNDVQANALIADILHAQMMEELSTRKSIMLDAKVLGHEIIDHPNKIQAMGAAAVTLVTQVADRSRLLIAFLPEIGRTTYEHTHNLDLAGLPIGPGLAGLAIGATFASWGMLVGEPLNIAVRKFPKTVTNIRKTFPKMITMFEDALPGMNRKDTLETQDITMLERIKKLGKSAIGLVSKGFVAIGTGTTAYALTSVARGDSTSETRKVNTRVSREGGIVLAGLGAGLIGTVDWLAKNGQEGTAHWIDEWIISNNYLWYAIAGAIVLVNFAAAKMKQKVPEYFEPKDQLITAETPVSEVPFVSLKNKIKNLIPDRNQSSTKLYL